jgi:transposase InsO family protein
VRHADSQLPTEGSRRPARQKIGTLPDPPLFIEPGSPWEHGYGESFDGKLRDELLNRELFDTVLETQVLANRDRWRHRGVRPHSSLGYRPPALQATLVRAQVSEARQLPYPGTYDPGLTIDSGTRNGARPLSRMTFQMYWFL